MTIGVLIPLADWNNSCFMGPLKTNAYSGLFDGNYTDINAFWFFSLGDLIILTLYLQCMILPIIQMIMGFLIRYLKQMKDQGKCRRPRNYYATKTKTIYCFVDKYSGPDFDIAIYCSAVLTLITVTMMFSCMMPIMVPLTTFALTVLFVA